MINVLERTGIQGPYLTIIKAMHGMMTANIKLNGESVKGITPKLEKRQGCPLLPYLFNIVLNVLVREIRQQKEIKWI